MSEFQVRSTIIACVVLIIGLLFSIVAVALPEWTRDFDNTGLTGKRFIKFGLFQRCQTDYIDREERWDDTRCEGYETRNLEPGEGDWIAGARAMILLGCIFAIVGAVIGGVFIKFRLKILGFLVLAASIAACVFSLITIGIWVQKWSALFLRYQDRKAHFGVSLFLCVGSAIAYGAAAILYAAVLLLRVRQGKTQPRKETVPMKPRL